MDFRAVILVPALAGMAVFGCALALYAAHGFMTVLQSTGSGDKGVDWPDAGILDHVPKAVYLAFLIVIWLVPSLAVGRAVAKATGFAVPALLFPLAVFWLVYPVSQLSSICGPTPWLPLWPGVFPRLAQQPAAVAGYYLLSGATLLLFAAGYTLVFVLGGPVPILVGAPVIAVAWLVYARLLGRLAFSLSFTKAFLVRRKQKRKRAEGSPKDRPWDRGAAGVEATEKPKLTQPSDLPPLNTLDGPLTGYDLVDDDQPPPLAPAAAPDAVAPRPPAAREPRPPRTGPELGPLERSRVWDEADDDNTPYDALPTEVRSEDLIPASMVEPRESEMRLIDRSDRPKQPARVWTPGLFGFLIQPGTIWSVGQISLWLAMVGAMAWLARINNPVPN